MVIGLLGQKLYPWRNLWSPAENCKHESQESLVLKRHSQPDKGFFILSAADIPIDQKGRSQARTCQGDRNSALKMSMLCKC